MSASVACLNMIKQQLRTNNILDEQILNLFIKVARFQFVPQPYQDFSFADMHIPLAHQQIMMTPLEEAKILQSGQFNKDAVVLEIGTGSGFLSALLSQLCEKVVSIDIHNDFIEHAQTIHQKLNLANIELLQQDATQMIEFPYLFDAIICTSGIEYIPQNWIKMLKPQGKIFAPIGESTYHAQWVQFNEGNAVGHEFVFQANVPSLVQAKPAKFIF